VVGVRRREGGREDGQGLKCIQILVHRFLTAYDFPGNLEELEMLVTDALNKAR